MSQDFPYSSPAMLGSNTWTSIVKGCQWYDRNFTCVPSSNALVTASTICTCGIGSIGRGSDGPPRMTASRPVTAAV